MKKRNVGDTFFLVANARWMRGGQVVITKVGRKWLTLDNGSRADSETLRIDGRGMSSPGILYENEQAYIDFRDHLDLCAKIKQRFLSFRAGGEVTPEQAKAIAEILGIKTDGAE